MSININKCIVTKNAHLLRFVSIENGSVSSSSVNAAERFLRSASVLSQGGSLTLQIYAKKDSESTAYILSGPETQIATQDIDWIFNGCAETASPDVSFEDCIGDSTRVYSVISSGFLIEPFRFPPNFLIISTADGKSMWLPSTATSM